MERIGINNPEAVLNDVSDLYKKNEALNALVTQLMEAHRVTSNPDVWTENGADAMACNAKLKQNIDQLTRVVSYNDEFGAIVDCYANDTITTSKQTDVN